MGRHLTVTGDGAASVPVIARDLLSRDAVGFSHNDDPLLRRSSGVHRTLACPGVILCSCVKQAF